MITKKAMCPFITSHKHELDGRMHSGPQIDKENDDDLERHIVRAMGKRLTDIHIGKQEVRQCRRSARSHLDRTGKEGIGRQD
jgi:hypothetical protein